MWDSGTRAFIEHGSLAEFLRAARKFAPEAPVVGWQDPLTKELKTDHPFLCNLKAAEAGWKCLVLLEYEEEDEKN